MYKGTQQSNHPTNNSRTVSDGLSIKANRFTRSTSSSEIPNIIDLSFFTRPNRLPLLIPSLRYSTALLARDERNIGHIFLAGGIAGGFTWSCLVEYFSSQVFRCLVCCTDFCLHAVRALSSCKALKAQAGQLFLFDFDYIHIH